ncbi:MAG: hypothetical protein HEEMFOPI_01559 [Holosporales bacterium]
MSSKQLDSILKKLPSATAQPIQENNISNLMDKAITPPQKEPTERIVAVIPKSLKKQIKQRIEDSDGETEKSIILKGLKAIGFNVKDEWLIDKRSIR